MSIYSIILVYFIIISLVAVFITIHDERAARNNTWRVEERVLLTVSVFGGSVAMLMTMLSVRHKTNRVKFMAGIPLIILAQIVIVIFVFNQSLSVSYYDAETDKINGRIKLALIKDLHSCDYGDGQIGLLSAIDKEAPDAILLCGDIFDDILPPDNTILFIAGISGKYPCYYVSGNHEFWSGKVDVFKDIRTSYGVKVLAGTTDVINVRGDKISICGIDDPDTDRFESGAAPYTEQIRDLSLSVDKDIYTILLSHRPERIEEFVPLEPDLVVSGHAHGGQWRIPFILENGLLAPNQGFFPKYTNGEYFFGDTELIVSRGLARESTSVPRAFNRPEIVIINLE
jgi:predicted MPP superfamily phosphohydrolase